MHDIKAQFPDFVPNQILTNIQLNQLRSYLEAEDRETRRRLGGAGIVCGLRFEVAEDRILIEPGFGLTSDGDLVIVDRRLVLTHHRGYVDPDRDQDGRILYARWAVESDPTKMRDIYELAPDDELTADDVQGERPFAELNPNVIEGRVLVLYVERNPVRLDTCLATSCDNKGRNVALGVRALIVPEELLDQAPVCAKPPALHRVERVIDLAAIHTADDLDSAFSTVAAASGAVLGSRITELFAGQALVAPPGDAADAVSRLLAGVASAQYRYDALKRLTDAYNEAAIGLHHLVRSCSPPSGFERHLMLGSFEGPRPDPYRNDFMPSSLRDVLSGERTRVRALLERLRALLTEPVPADTPPVFRVAPSHSEAQPLGARFRPFYFPDIGARWRPVGWCRADLDWPFRTPNLEPMFAFDYNVPSLLHVERARGVALSQAIGLLEQARQKHNVEFDVLPSYLVAPYLGDGKRATTIRETLSKRRDAFVELVTLVRTLLVDEDRERVAPIAELINKQAKSDVAMEKTWREWQHRRRGRHVHCELQALEGDYRLLRSEAHTAIRAAAKAAKRLELLLAAGLKRESQDAVPSVMLADRFASLVFEHPASWLDSLSSPPEIGLELERLLGLRPSERLDRAVGLAVQDVIWTAERLLGNPDTGRPGALPPDLLAFNPDVFEGWFAWLARSAIVLAAYGRLFASATGTAAGQRPAAAHQRDIDELLKALGAPAASASVSKLWALFEGLEGVLARDVSVFTNLAGQVRGLEHLMGVKKGGTLVLVCDGDDDDAPVVGDFALEGKVACCCAPTADDDCPTRSLQVDTFTVLIERAEGMWRPVDLSWSSEDLFGPEGKSGTLKTVPQSALGARLEASPSGIHYELATPLPNTVDWFDYEFLPAGPCGSKPSIGTVVVVAIGPKGGRVEGTVFVDQAPATEVIVHVAGSSYLATTDANGRYVFNLEPGPYRLVATVASASGAVDIVVEAGETVVADISIELPRFGRIRGDVTVDGKPVKDAKVTLARLNLLGDVAHATTDERGQYELSQVPLGSYLLAVRFSNLWQQRAVELSTTTTLIEDFALVREAAGSVQVRVLDEKTGAPVPEAEVQLESSSGVIELAPAPNGQVTFQNQQAGIEYAASARKPRFLSLRAGPAPLVAGAVLSLDVFLQPIGRPPYWEEINRFERFQLPGYDAARVEKTFAVYEARLERFVGQLTGIDRTGIEPRVLEAALDFVHRGSIDPLPLETELTSEYRRLAKPLIAMSRGHAAEAEPGRAALTVITHAFLDKLSVLSPARLEPQGRDALEAAAASLKSAGLSFAELQDRYAGDASFGEIAPPVVREIVGAGRIR